MPIHIITHLSRLRRDLLQLSPWTAKMSDVKSIFKKIANFTAEIFVTNKTIAIREAPGCLFLVGIVVLTASCKQASLSHRVVSDTSTQNSHEKELSAAEPTVTIQSRQLTSSTPRPSDATKTSVMAEAAPSDDGLDAYSHKVEDALVRYTNNVRAQANLPPLAEDQRLADVARDWSARQKEKVNHDGYPEARIAMFETLYPGQKPPAISAENVIWAQAVPSDPEAAATKLGDLWRGSTVHYQNIIGSHQSIGIGIACIPDSQFGTDCAGTQIFAR